MFGRCTLAVLQGVISVENPLDQLVSFTVIVRATDNYNGTGRRRVATVPVRYASMASCYAPDLP